MIKAFKEYWEEVTKPSMAWVRRHWKGYGVYIAVCLLISLSPWLFYMANKNQNTIEGEGFTMKDTDEEES